MAPSRHGAPDAVLAALVENANDAIVCRDLEGRILTWNAAAERLFGWSAAEALGRDIALIHPPEVRDELAEQRARFARGEPPGVLETVRLTKDGRRIEVARSMSPVKNAAGETIAVSLVFRDIGEDRRAEREAARGARLATLSAQLAAAANRASTPLDALRECLERICAFGGWRLGHVLLLQPGPGLRPASSLWKMEQSERERFRPFVEATARYDFERARGPFAAVMLREKRPVWIEGPLPELGRLTELARAGMRSAFGFPIVGGGEVMALLEFYGDAHAPVDALLLDHIGGIAAQFARLIERSRAHAALAEREQQLRLVAENIPAMVAYFDQDLRCRFANAAYCDFYGVARNRVAGMRLDEITGGDDYPAGTARRAQRTPEGGVRHVEIRRVTDHAPEGSVRGYYALLLDVTEQVLAEEKIRASEARLRAIFDNEPECVELVAADGRLVEINRAGLAMLEADAVEEIRVRGLAEFVLPQYRASFTACMERALRGESAALEFEIAGLKGARRWVEAHAADITLPGEGAPGVLAVIRDISERKRAEFLATHDALTGLPKRELFGDRLEIALAQARRRGEALGAILIGLDGFGKFNESLGTETGDELLRAVAARLRASLREVDTIARVGGDEFAVLVEGIAERGAVLPVADKLAAALAAPFELRGRELYVSASAGIAVHPGPDGTGASAAALMENAAAALARMKREGGGGYQLYEQPPLARREGRLELEIELRHALQRNELALHYQPKVDLKTGAVVGAEALVRWLSSRLGSIGPAHFIPVAEESGLILPIGEWVLRTACAQAAAWRAAGHPIAVAVNLSPRQFRQRGLAATVAAALAGSGLPAGALQLEITEGTAMSNAERTVGLLQELRRAGVSLAVDDFGTGYSSLGYLQRFPLDGLKIDRAFVRDILRNPGDRAIVRATIALAHSLGLKVVAEGVETVEQQALLSRLRCDQGQGFYYSPALPAAEFLRLLEAPHWEPPRPPARRIRASRDRAS